MPYHATCTICGRQELPSWDAAQEAATECFLAGHREVWFGVWLDDGEIDPGLPS